MTYEEYYGSDYTRLTAAKAALDEIASSLQSISHAEDDVQPIVYFCSRIKHPDSMIKKLEEHSLPLDSKSALSNVFDAVGLRIICSFESDVYYIVKQLENNKAITVIQKKDYISCPKPNGYRSIHLCVKLNELNIPAEIQIRTIAMDFWATLEHQLKYKKEIENEALMRDELKRCADEIASVDLTMQTIREIIKEL